MLHDGDYLKHWDGDETIGAQEMDRPIHYVSYYAAEAYCKALNKMLPLLSHYQSATGSLLHPSGLSHTYIGVAVSYDVSYTPSDFNFVQMEWTATWGASSPDAGKRVIYQHGTIHSQFQGSPDYARELDKRYTGRSLGFRCAEYSQRPYNP